MLSKSYANPQSFTSSGSMPLGLLNENIASDSETPVTIARPSVLLQKGLKFSTIERRVSAFSYSRIAAYISNRSLNTQTSAYIESSLDFERYRHS